MDSDSFYTVVYCHGKGGHPWNGQKITRLRKIILENGMNLVSIPFDENDTVTDMIDQTVAVCIDKALVPDKLILIGSSRGAFIASSVSDILDKRSKRVSGVFLLAPAIFDDNPYYPTSFIPPSADKVGVIHGYGDEIVCPGAVWRFCSENKVQVQFVDDGHRLADSGHMIGMMVDGFLYEILAQ